MTTCYNCQAAIEDSNRSKEHIIPDALGGKPLFSYNLLCKNCNNEWGSDIDKGIISQLGHIADLAQVKRERPAKPSKRQETTCALGSDTWVLPNGQKGYQIVLKLPKKKPLTFRGEDPKKLKKQALKVLKQKQKKDQSIDPEAIMSTLTWTNSGDIMNYFGNHKAGTKRLTKVGGNDFFLGLTKIAVALAIESGVNQEELEIPLLYIRKEKGIKMGKFIYAFAKPYYPNTPVYSPGSDAEVSHVVYLRGDKNHKILYAYIELFNTWNYILFLRDNYYGPDLEKSIVVDTQTGRKYSNADIKIDMSWEQVRQIPYWPFRGIWEHRFKERNIELMEKIQDIQDQLRSKMGQ